MRRASFLYADPEREVHVQTLNHLRHYRNRSVHGGESSATIEAYLYQLKRYVEQLFLFHLTNSYGFRSFERAAAFLSLPPGPADLRRMDENRRRESEEARAAAVEAPTLALAGGESFQFMRDAARKLAEAMPDARARLLEGQTHAVAPEALAPVLGGFFGDRA